MPDIMCKYETFWLGFEVTLQRGMKQYEAEGEWITRHIGKLQKKIILEKGDKKPVFGLFVAEKINEEVISHLFSVANRFSQVYAGQVRIVPLERKYFLEMMKSASSNPKFTNRMFFSFFEEVFSVKLSAIGELDWFNFVQKKACGIGMMKG